MGPRRTIIHKGAGCTAKITTLVKTSCQFFIGWNFVLPKSKQTDAAVLLFSNLNFFFLNESINDSARCTSCIMIKQIMQLFIVYLQECTLNHYISLAFSFFNLLEYQFNNPRNDSQVLFLNSYSIATSHRVSLATPSLPICEYRCIIPEKCTKNQVLHTCLEDIRLTCAWIKNFIKGEWSILAYDQLVLLLVALDTNVWWFI